jgi:hypothetical protein
MQLQPVSRIAFLGLFCVMLCRTAVAQTNGQAAPENPLPETPQPASQQPASPPQPVPDTVKAAPLQPRPPQTPEEKEAARIAALGTVNGVTYDQPSHKDQFFDYLRDSYGLPAFARSTVRSLYSEARGKPEGWGQDFPGYAQRFGSAVAVTAINGNVRFAMETIFNEDMRYIPCHGCSAKRKVWNTVLAEFTARHDVDGRRFFTLTPVIADFSGPIIANAFWYPNHDPFGGVVGTRTVFATRIGQRLFTEFVLERRHHDRKIQDNESLRQPGKPQPDTQPPTPPVSQPGAEPAKP